jgi:putative DNA primase/helicase
MIREIKEAVAGREVEILDKLGIRWRDGHPHIRCPYLAHFDKNPSWRWDAEKRVAFCTCTDRAQNIFDIIIRVEGGDFARAADRAAEILGRPDLVRGGKKSKRPKPDDDAPQPGLSLAEYAAGKALPEDFLRQLGLSDTVYNRKPAVRIPYRASGGTEVAVRFRIAAEGADKFRWAKGSKATPYGAERLSDARDAGRIVLVEGESDAATLWFHDIPAIGLPGATTWHEDRDAPLLDGIDTVYVVIEPDTGGAAVLKWLSHSSIRPRARLVKLPPGTKDPSALHIADPDGFRAAFQRALDEARPCSEPEPKKAKDDDGKAGRALVLYEPEPWPQPVDGAQLLNEIASGIKRYVVFADTAVDAVALWCVGTHAFNAFTIFPRLVVTSPEPRCGKTTLLDVIERLVPRPLAAANITAPALFRTIEAARPSLLLDEADTFAKENEDLRGILNSGHRRNGSVIRVVESGKNYEPRQFSTWAPIALASIGSLPATVMDRSIIVSLRRRRPDEAVESLRLDRPTGLDRLARMAARWAADQLDRLRDADPAVPKGVFNRAADNWHPLLAFADAAGGDWPARARSAAVALAAEHSDESRRVQLLADIADAFVAKHTDRMSSEDLTAYLIELEDRPWAEWSKGRPLSKNQLARLIKPFGVSPGSIRLDDGRTPKGYSLAALDDALARYLPEHPFSNRHTATSKAQPSDSKDSETPQEGRLWRFETAENPSVSAGCGVVADENPPNADSGERATQQRQRIVL